MRVLRLGMTGADVERWQTFLRGQGFAVTVNGRFDEATEAGTKAFQRARHIDADGVAGNQTFGSAMLAGFALIDDPDDHFPAAPAFPPLLSTAARQQVFGKFAFEHRPLPRNAENIVITGDWEARNIVTLDIPQLRGFMGNGSVRFHRVAANQLVSLWKAWEAAGLLNRVLSYEGSFVPRFIRGSTTQLSNHAFGTAFDINAASNPLGAVPPRVGMRGCVRELVAIANDHGFFWGGHFSGRPDGMHFEVAVVKP